MHVPLILGGFISTLASGIVLSEVAWVVGLSSSVARTLGDHNAPWLYLSLAVWNIAHKIPTAESQVEPFVQHSMTVLSVAAVAIMCDAGCWGTLVFAFQFVVSLAAISSIIFNLESQPT